MSPIKPIQLFATVSLCVGFFTTSHAYGDASYADPLPGISAEQKLDFYLGEAIFQKFWIPAPSSTTASDGLGPIFNARSCNNCHINNGRGHAPDDQIAGSQVPSFLVRLGPKQTSKFADTEIYQHTGDPVYGQQFQIAHTAGVLSEGDYQLNYQYKTEVLADGSKVTLRKPNLAWQKLHYGPLHKNTGISMRVSPPLVGMGLLDNIPEATILANADPDDIDRDGISGKANWVKYQGKTQLGRFGYKATMPSVSAQNQSAFNTDLGLSTPDFPAAFGDCSEQQVECRQAPNGNSPHLENLEVDSQQVALVDSFIALSAPPAMRNLTQPWFVEGKSIFDDIGCAACHIAKMTTANNSKFSVLNNRTFYPFTDMLLHDLGDDLASEFPEASAEPREWRTAPLWGLGLSHEISGRIGFLHDGRAQSLEEAILWHGGEALSSKEKYTQLNAQQRLLLQRFLESL